MSNIEQAVKAQYSKFFLPEDWYPFKRLAEYYLETAAFLKTDDIQIDDNHRLWVRNVRKRLFIGVACELLLKARYLRQGITPLKRGGR